MKNYLYPEKWLINAEATIPTALSQDETIALLMHFEIKDTTESRNTHSFFSIVRKKNKAIARMTMCHGDETHVCNEHTHHIVDYPIENEANLIEEIRTFVLMAVVKMMEENNPTRQIDIEKNILYIQTPPNTSNAEFLENLTINKEPETQNLKPIITKLFGLENTTTSTLVPSEINTQTIETENNLVKLANLEKAASEMDLIKKFGKKRIEELAKKMKYTGTLINKSKTNVKSSKVN